MKDNEFKKIEEDQKYEYNSNEIPPSDIVAFNELRSCADLLRMSKEKQLEIQPDFEREIVWKNPAQTRFIDSLSKQLPIPSMCISLDYKTEKRIIIDGLQRMQTIINFDDDEWKLSELMDIDDRLSGKSVYTIKTKTPEIYSRVQNVMIPITVIRCDFSKKAHNEYLFTIFHRLNSGGLKLNNQEIRNCIYNGELNTLLKEFSRSPQWKKLLRIKPNRSYRFSNEELILRFFAFYDSLNAYTGRLAKFLNDYMDENREPEPAFINAKKDIFNRTLSLINDKILENQSAHSFSKAVLEGLLIGVSKNIDNLESIEKDQVKTKFNSFNSLTEFNLDNLKEGLSSKEKVLSRLTASIQIFS